MTGHYSDLNKRCIFYKKERGEAPILANLYWLLFSRVWAPCKFLTTLTDFRHISRALFLPLKTIIKSPPFFLKSILSEDTTYTHVSALCVSGKKSLSITVTYWLKYFFTQVKGLCLPLFRFYQAPALTRPDPSRPPLFEIK